MIRSRLKRLFVCLILLFPALLHAEKAADLPLPQSYVNDFADVLSPETKQSLEDLCRQLHDKANADLAVVTIHTLDDGQTIDQFTGELEEKWKLGKKGSDRSAIYVLVTGSRKMRVEVGYGLEGVLNDAKVGRILDDAVPDAKQGDWDGAMRTGTQEIVQDIAVDARVTITPTVHRYRRVGSQPQEPAFRAGHVVLGLIFLIVLLILVVTGHAGWAWMLLWSVMGGGGGGGRDDDDRGGGFGGMGGGSSGGGGASRDF